MTLADSLIETTITSQPISEIISEVLTKCRTAAKEGEYSANSGRDLPVPVVQYLRSQGLILNYVSGGTWHIKWIVC